MGFRGAVVPVQLQSTVYRGLVLLVLANLAFKNIHHISNRQFVSKLVERAVSNQLQPHLVKNNLLPTLQSAYRPSQTARLKIKNDILINMDKQHATLLILLEMIYSCNLFEHNIYRFAIHKFIFVKRWIFILNHVFSRS